MLIEEVMTREPVCCTPDTGLQEVAKMMVEHDCGEIPIVQSTTNRRVLGVVTDRDIVSRVVAQGKNPLDQKAGTCMSQPVVTVRTGQSVDDCILIMEAHRIRRVPVVDDAGLVRGIVSQADIAQHASNASTGELVTKVSQAGAAKS